MKATDCNTCGTPNDDASEAVTAAFEAGYLAGFNASGEGWNGEYPFQAMDKLPQHNSHWTTKQQQQLRIYLLSIGEAKP